MGMLNVPDVHLIQYGGYVHKLTALTKYYA